MVEFRVIEGGGRVNDRKRPPQLAIVPRGDDDIPVLGYLPARPVAPEEEVFKTPQDFDRSGVWCTLLDVFLEQFPDTPSQDVGDMISQAAVEVHQAGMPLTLSRVSERFWEVWNEAMREERRRHMRQVLGAQVILPEEWELFTTESAQRSTGDVSSVPSLTVYRDPEQAVEARLSQPSLLTLHLSGIALKFGVPPSEVDGEVETFLRRLWATPSSMEEFSFMDIARLFSIHLDHEWEWVNESVVGPGTLTLSREELESRDLREALIEEMVSMGVTYEVAQRLIDHVVETCGWEEISRDDLHKKVQSKARRWLRRQARTEQALKARLEQERQQGLLTSSEIGIQSLIAWLVESHGLRHDDATALVQTVLGSWDADQPGVAQNLGNLGATLEDTLTQR